MLVADSAEFTITDYELPITDSHETTRIYQNIIGSIRPGWRDPNEFGRCRSDEGGRARLLRIARLPTEERSESRIARFLPGESGDSSLESAGHQSGRRLHRDGTEGCTGRVGVDTASVAGVLLQRMVAPE